LNLRIVNKKQIAIIYWTTFNPLPTMHPQRVFWIMIWFLVTQVSSGIIFSGCKPKKDKERVVLNPRFNDDNQPNPLPIAMIHDDISKLTDYQKMYAQIFYPTVVYFCKSRVSTKHITRLIVTYLAPPLVTKIHAESNVFKYLLSFDNQLLATSVSYTHDKVTLWRMDNGEKHATLHGHTDKVTDFIFTSDNQYLISASADKTLIIWSVRTSNNLHTFRGHNRGVTSCSLTADNQRMLSCSSSGVTGKIWSVETGVCDVTIPIGKIFHQHPPKFCNHDQHIITSGIDNIQLWTVAGELVRRLVVCNNGNDPIFFVVSEVRLLFTNRFAFPCPFYAVHVWDFATGTCLQIFQGHDYKVRSGLFVRDNNGVVSGDYNFTVCIWGVYDGICTHQINNCWVMNSKVYWLVEENTEGIIISTANRIHILAVHSDEKICTFPIGNGNTEVSFDGRFLVHKVNRILRFLEFTHYKNITHN